ncbi:hypothetical protein [Nevskia sp.]|uniref:hypothetical protein n=1 Tax=Nevskia sp. TaxID=1929292 RepID=UPI0025F9DFE3|nr:hypothetical protein [Nevskia sp.]
MNHRDRRRFERVIRVLSFLHEHAEDFSTAGNVGALTASLETHRNTLEAAISRQKPERIDKRQPINNLTASCRQIATIARAIIRRDKNFVGRYKLPTPITDLSLIAHADSLLTKLEFHPDDDSDAQQAKSQLRARFASFELAPDFVETLRKQRNALRDAIEFNQIKTQTGVETTSSINTLLHATTLDIQDLDAIMRRFNRLPDKLKAWRSASRVEVAGRKVAEELTT